jgi:hypothetical protein
LRKALRHATQTGGRSQKRQKSSGLTVSIQFANSRTVLVTPISSLPLADIARSVRILRWTFRRGDESVVCELGLSSDSSAYELRVLPLWNPTVATTELFDDALSAFQRQGTIERILIAEGWSLDRFESDRVARAGEGIVLSGT